MRLESIDTEMLRAITYGAAIGEALGVPYKLSRRGSFTCHGMMGFGTWGMPVGTYSEGTGLMLAQLDSIASCHGLNESDMRLRFGRWLHHGDYMADNDTFDCGGTNRTAIELGRGMGNSVDSGALIRVAPLAALGCSEYEITSISAMTHTHKTSKKTCAEFVDIVSTAHRSLFDAKAKVIWLGIAGLSQRQIRSRGYVEEAFMAALWCFSCTSNYRDCVTTAVNLGDDTDVTACLAGALAASAYGFDSIPSEWFDELRNKGEIERVLDKFDRLTVV